MLTEMRLALRRRWHGRGRWKTRCHDVMECGVRVVASAGMARPRMPAGAQTMSGEEEEKGESRPDCNGDKDAVCDVLWNEWMSRVG